MSGKRVWRCAIYTRKSSEEGLEQDFNSLHAQREACEAYIRSQAHEGWRVLPRHFDDGGHSGGTLDRPALKELLKAVEAGDVDIVVIYKIDRLTRSLTDFAKLAEQFDARGVSFVSVTQQFNTTTSMGRLMLNVLLSFAQFEREVTGERIRDKIAASKKKGMWMGGTVPLGYEAKDRSLVINEEDAATIHTIFDFYLKLGSVSALEEELDRRGIRTKTRTYENGRTAGNRPFTRGHLYRLLSSPIYIGHVPHKYKSYPGQHDGIIDRATWDRVQASLAANTQGPRKRRGRTRVQTPLLAQIFTDEGGTPFIPNHANKKGRRYRYYVEKLEKDSNRRPRRIPALEIEAAVRSAVRDLLQSPARLLDTLAITGADETALTLDGAGKLSQAFTGSDPTEQDRILRPLLKQVILGDQDLIIRFGLNAFREALGLTERSTDALRGGQNDPATADPEITVPVRIRTRGIEMKLVLPGANGDLMPRNPDPALIRAVARAHKWFEILKTGEAPSVGAIARAEGVTTSYVSRTLRLAFLSPHLVEQILDGTQTPDMTTDYLMATGNVPLRWEG
jgi:DNA invertase Pin-like site-specific DNA recombinase